MSSLIFLVLAIVGYATFFWRDHVKERKPHYKRLHMQLDAGYIRGPKKPYRNPERVAAVLQNLGVAYQVHRDLDAARPVHECPFILNEGSRLERLLREPVAALAFVRERLPLRLPRLDRAWVVRVRVPRQIVG